MYRSEMRRTSGFGTAGKVRTITRSSSAKAVPILEWPALPSDRMVSWRELEERAPEVARPGRELIDRFGFGLLGTIRRDGTPRISPVETHIVGDELMLVMIAGTWKARDVVRDPRVVLNSPVLDPADPVAELKVRGRVVSVGQEQQEGTAEAIERKSGWRPRTDWHFFRLELDDAAHIAWDAGNMTMHRWTPDRGVERVERPLAVLS